MNHRFQNLETPCFILDENEFVRNYQAFLTALLQKFKKVGIGLSVKTNSLPYLLSLAKKTGCYAEVVSHDEYELAKKCGFKGSLIIYNGPLKSKETFIEALCNGSVVNIETKRELDWLKELPPTGEYKVGLRLNIDIAQVSPQDGGEHPDSRFGFSAENGEFQSALSSIQSLPHTQLVGLHLHRTTSARRPEFYKNLTRYAVELIKAHHLELEYLDLGGGYFGIFDGKPSYEEYANAIAESLCSLPNFENLQIIVEPGNALTASVFSFLSEVIDYKVAGDVRFITTDGSRNDVDPLFKKSNYLKEIIYSNNSEACRDSAPTQVISGCSCLEFDRLFTLHDSPMLVPGDRILYKNVGAYTMCLSPLFIRFFPSVYSVCQSGNIHLVRDRWTADQYIALSTIN